MNQDQIIATRPNKTIYRDGDTCVKLFCPGYSKADILNEALNQARIEEEVPSLHIPKVLAVTTIDGQWAIVSQFIEGKTLAQLMAEHPEKRDEYLERLVDIQLSIQANTCIRLKQTLIYDFNQRSVSCNKNMTTFFKFRGSQAFAYFHDAQNA